MSERTTIRAVDLVRRIRDEQAAKLSGKSEGEVLEFFKRAGDAAKKAAEGRLSGKNSSPKSVS